MTPPAEWGCVVSSWSLWDGALSERVFGARILSTVQCTEGEVRLLLGGPDQGSREQARMLEEEAEEDLPGGLERFRGAGLEKRADFGLGYLLRGEVGQQGEGIVEWLFRSPRASAQLWSRPSGREPTSP